MSHILFRLPLYCGLRKKNVLAMLKCVQTPWCGRTATEAVTERSALTILRVFGVLAGHVARFVEVHLFGGHVPGL